MFEATGVQCLLMLNATSGGDTLEDVVRMYRSKMVIGCIATKLDEAVNLGTVLDVAVRHRLVMHYMANDSVFRKICTRSILIICCTARSSRWTKKTRSRCMNWIFRC